jgi:hypothetical protein
VVEGGGRVGGGAGVVRGSGLASTVVGIGVATCSRRCLSGASDPLCPRAWANGAATDTMAHRENAIVTIARARSGEPPVLR